VFPEADNETRNGLKRNMTAQRFSPRVDRELQADYRNW